MPDGQPHRLLRRQLRRWLGDETELPPGLEAFVKEVDEAYCSSDAGRLMLERSLELSSQELLQANQGLRAKEELLRKTLHATADGILVVSQEGKVLYVNDRFKALWRVPDRVIRLGETEQIREFVLDQLETPGDYVEKIKELYTGDRESFDILRFKDGRVFERYSSPLMMGDEVSGRVWTFSDVTELHTLVQQLRDRAFHDPLTGLPNRARFMDRLEHAIERSRRLQVPVFVLFLDLDDFKAINDTHGSAAGDQTLKLVAKRIGEQVRPGDTVARLGGDEFGILFEGVHTASGAHALSQRVLDAVRKPATVQGREVRLDGSIGVAEGDSSTTAAELLSRADVALFSAKKRGKGRVEFYHPDVHSLIGERYGLMADLRGAAERGELEVHYQPVLHLDTGATCGAEALVRWQHPTRGMLAPDLFVPSAEESGLIGEIGEFVLREACELLSCWTRDFPDRHLCISVNVSARQLSDSEFPAYVRKVISETGVPADRLTLEVTESVLLENTQHALLTLEDLSAMGIRLALDDFGTGYSSLSYLTQLPFTVLKMDRSFIRNLRRSERDTFVAEAMIALGQKLRVQVLAEGIETVEQLRYLRSLGCDLGQGFLFSIPLPASQLDAFLSQEPQWPPIEEAAA